MIINRKQLSAFASSGEAEFTRRLVDFLQEQFEEARQYAPEELRIEIAPLIPRAKAYELMAETDVAAYVIAAFLLGGEFDREFPAARQVLTSPVLNAADKAQWLEEWTLELFHTLLGRAEN